MWQSQSYINPETLKDSTNSCCHPSKRRTAYNYVTGIIISGPIGLSGTLQWTSRRSTFSVEARDKSNLIYYHYCPSCPHSTQSWHFGGIIHFLSFSFFFLIITIRLPFWISPTLLLPAMVFIAIYFMMSALIKQSFQANGGQPKPLQSWWLLARTWVLPLLPSWRTKELSKLRTSETWLNSLPLLSLLSLSFKLSSMCSATTSVCWNV